MLSLESLDIISVNLWHILISLANLALIYYFAKKFLFGPVHSIFEKREAEIADRYAKADLAQARAEESKANWESQMQGANARADEIIQKATEQAKRREEAIIAEARAEAEGMIRHAEQEIVQETQKAKDTIKKEIVEVSGMLSEKMLEREIKIDDHRALIDSFIEGIGDENE